MALANSLGRAGPAREKGTLGDESETGLEGPRVEGLPGHP